MFDEVDVLYRDALEDSTFNRVCTDKEIIYADDVNGGVYGGEIVFDGMQFANSGRWLSFKDGYITIPYVIAFQSSVDISARKLSGSIALLKNGGWNIIDSLQVEYNDVTVVNQRRLTNMLINYRVLSRWSKDDIAKYGMLSWFAGPDDPAFRRLFLNNPLIEKDESQFQGDGIPNNLHHSSLRVDSYVYEESENADAVAAAAEEATERLEFFRSELCTPIRPALYNGSLYALGSTIVSKQVNHYGTPAADAILTVANLQSTFEPVFRADAGAGAIRVYQTDLMIKLRLCDLHPFFECLQLIKSPFIKITLWYNAIRATFSTENVDLQAAIEANVLPGVPEQRALSHTGHTQLHGSCTPVIIGAGNDYNPGIELEEGDYTVECNVVSTETPESQALPVSVCRLYVPAYQLDPDTESSLITVNPVRSIQYEEHYTYHVRNIGPNSTFSSVVTNGIVDPLYVVMVPYTSASQNLMAAAMNGKHEYQSLFSSAPSTTTFMPMITQFNVKVSGRSMFQRSKQYDFEMYLDEISKSGLNMGVEQGLSSGLLSYKQWSLGHRYYVCNISRRLQDEDRIPRSIEISGINATPRTMDYVVFVVYRKGMKISMIDGSVEQ